MNRGSLNVEGLRRSARKSTNQGQPSLYSTPSTGPLDREASESEEEAVVVGAPIRIDSFQDPPAGLVRNPEIQNPEIRNPETVVGDPEISLSGMARQVTRLRYKRFKGDGSQDVDDWLCEFNSTATANQEDRETKLRIFQGLLKGEALKWYQDVPDTIRNDWPQLSLSFLRTFREAGGEARALGRLSKMTMKSGESVRKYSQRVKGLLQKLTTDIAASVQVEWYVAGFPEEMGFQIRQTRPTTLREAMEAAQNYENSKQSLRQALRRSKESSSKRSKVIRKSRRRDDSGSDTSGSEGSTTSESSDSESSDSRSPSPKKVSGSKGSRRDHDRIKTRVKVETPEGSSLKMMKDIQESLAAIKVNLAESRRPRRAIPMVRSNIWCTRCGEAGHYPNECPRMPPKKVQFVDEEGTVYFTVPDYEEEEPEYMPVYQIAPTYGRGKAPQQIYRAGYAPGRPQAVGYPSGSNPGMTSQPRRAVSFEKQNGLCFICGDDTHYANTCPRRGLGQGAPLELPCQNCKEYGHGSGQCPHPARPRPTFKQVEVPPRDQTALNYGHKEGIDNPEN